MQILLYKTGTFGLTESFLIRFEYELKKGYADLYLEPDRNRFPNMMRWYVIEMKYLKRGEAGNMAGETLRHRQPEPPHIDLVVVYRGRAIAGGETVSPAY